jgi:hypothetical protein
MLLIAVMVAMALAASNDSTTSGSLRECTPSTITFHPLNEASFAMVISRVLWTRSHVSNPSSTHSKSSMVTHFSVKTSTVLIASTNVSPGCTM